jgi:hypothetical protein
MLIHVTVKRERERGISLFLWILRLQLLTLVSPTWWSWWWGWSNPAIGLPRYSIIIIAPESVVDDSVVFIMCSRLEWVIPITSALRLIIQSSEETESVPSSQGITVKLVSTVMSSSTWQDSPASYILHRKLLSVHKDIFDGLPILAVSYYHQMYRWWGTDSMIVGIGWISHTIKRHNSMAE